MRLLVTLLLATALAPESRAEGWPQWGRNAQHESNSPTAGQRLDRIHAEVVIDPFADAEKASAGGNLLVHYQVPLVDGNDLFLVLKGGIFTGRTSWESQTWSVRNLRQEGGGLVTRWTFPSDWKPVPFGSPSWEPVYHCVLTADAVWAPGAGGTLLKISRENGSLLARVNPFGTAIDPTIFVTGPPTIDAGGNLFYNAIQLNPGSPWGADVLGSWLVRVAANGVATKASFASLTPNAPPANALCTSSFSENELPFPPAPDAIAPGVLCGSQRPGINVAPAIAEDGTIYTISRAHFTDRWGYLVAATADLTPRWSTSLRNRFSDGCNVTIPPNGTPGGCRSGATTGVDPADNQPGSGRVLDLSTSSPTVTPDGSVLYGAYTRYNYAQGHLMKFAADGTYLGAFGFGWDLTPAIYRHDGTWSILIKENRYPTGSYCSNPSICPGDRTLFTPSDPEQYFITQLDALLRVEWRHRNRETRYCARDTSGSVQCSEDGLYPNGFEWCVNAVAVDPRGVVYANSEDGNLYAIGQGGAVLQSIFLRTALGAAYTPLSIGDDGRIYTQNDGDLFIVGEATTRKRAAGRR